MRCWPPGRKGRTETIAVVLAALVWTAALVAGLGGPTVAQVVSNFGLVTVAGGAALACRLAAARHQDRLRRVWTLLALATASWAAGQAVWSWYELSGVEVPFPSWADLGYLGLVPLAAAALLTLPFAAQSAASRLRTVLDGLLIASSMLTLSWVLVLDSVVAAGSDGLVATVIGLAYPVGDAVVLTIVTYVLLRSRQTGWNSKPLTLVACGLAAIALADSGFVLLTSTGAYASGSLIDLGWFWGFTLLLLAARRRLTEPSGDADYVAAPRGLLLPYVAVVMALSVGISEQLTAGSVQPVTFWLRTIIVVLMVGRQILTIQENQFLLRHLEARVEERTAELRAREQHFAALVAHSSDVVTIIDTAGLMRYHSDSLKAVFGYGAEDLLGHHIRELVAESEAQLFAALEQVRSEPYRVVVVEVAVRHSAGHICMAEITITNLLEDPNVRGMVLNTRDVTQRKQLEDQLFHEALHDPLTSLANRVLFSDRVTQALRRADETDGQVVVLFCDLDDFKTVNDSLGHLAGDQMLIQVAQRLRGCVRPTDTVARLGGDEFAVLLELAGDEFDVLTVAERITGELRKVFTLGDVELHARGSVGIALAGPGADTADQLLRNADLAMYRAKSAGDGGFTWYDPEMHAQLVERVQLEAQLRTALDEGQLRVHYQPTLDLATGEIVGAEALVRWEHPTEGLVLPGRFIGVAEDTGLIRPIGDWVLREACAQAAAWNAGNPGRSALKINVNISARQMAGGTDIAADVAVALAASGLPAGCLLLEMTESVLMEHTEDNLALLHRLKALGVGLAIDDFGTGYSSLSYLHRFPVDVLKIDRSFVERLDGGASDHQLVGAIVRLSRSLEMSTVAEGIEKVAQWDELRRLGCETGQGFLFSKAVTPDQFARLLALPATDLPWVAAGLLQRA